MVVAAGAALGVGVRATAFDVLAASKRVRVVPLRALLPAMRRDDRTRRVLERTRALSDAGRKAMLALDHELAQRKLGEARAVLSRGFVRYYDPRRLARIEVLLGVSAMQNVRPDLARDAFVRALHLDGKLSLDAHYSPQVRAAFAKARASLPPRPAPRAEDVARVAKLAKAPAALVLRAEKQDGTVLVSAMLLDARRADAYAHNASLVLAGAKQRERVRRFSKRQLVRLEPLYPLPPKVAKKNGDIITPPPPPPPPPPTPWYKRWYTWVAVGAGVAAAIIVPLSVRRETVTGSISWR